MAFGAFLAENKMVVQPEIQVKEEMGIFSGPQGWIRHLAPVN